MRDLILQHANITTTVTFMIPIDTHPDTTPTAAQAAGAAATTAAGTETAAETDRLSATHASNHPGGEPGQSARAPLTDAQWAYLRDEESESGGQDGGGDQDAGWAADLGVVDVGVVDWDAAMDRLLAEQPPPAPPADADGYWPPTTPR